MLDYWMPLFHVIMGYFIIMIPMLLIIWGAFSNGSPKTKTVVACFLKIVGILVFLVALEHYYKGMFFYISLFIGGFAAGILFLECDLKCERLKQAENQC